MLLQLYLTVTSPAGPAGGGAPAAPAAPGGDMGGAMDMGADAGGAEAAAPEAGGEAGGGAEAEAGGDTALLTAPANRSRDINGKVSRGDGKGRRKVKMRDSEAATSARKRSTDATMYPKALGNSKPSGFDKLGLASIGALQEKQEEIYDKEETKLLRVNHEMKVLFEH